jgi:protein-S-isoprenylcysteine O-methyltransferase Ste14
MLWVRGLIFTLLVPAVIAVAIPRWIEPSRGLHSGWLRVGWIVIGAGAAFYFTCLVDFLRSGGTPAIFFTRDARFLLGEEPKVLVRKGLYRISRNPMYMGVVATVVGQALIFGSRALGVYAAFLWLCFHVVVVLLEEPHLRAERGAPYDDYRRHVPRWIGWPKR